MTICNKPRAAAVFGADIGKATFHVVGPDAAGAPLQKTTFRRGTLLPFFERASPVLVAMEACPGSQWLARKLQALPQRAAKFSIRRLNCEMIIRYPPAKTDRMYIGNIRVTLVSEV